MPGNTDRTNGGTGGLGNGVNGADNGIDTAMEGADSTSDSDDSMESIDLGHVVDLDANGAQTDDSLNHGEDRQETRPGHGILMARGLCQAKSNERCPQCQRLWCDTLLLQTSRWIAEAQAATDRWGAVAERCPLCRRLWVSHDYVPRDLQADNDPGMVRVEFGVFTDFEELLARSAAAPPALVWPADASTGDEDDDFAVSSHAGSDGDGDAGHAMGGADSDD